MCVGGFATEIGTASLDAAFGVLGLTAVDCCIIPTNSASRQIMLERGIAHDSARLHAGLLHVFSRLQATIWA